MQKQEVEPKMILNGLCKPLIKFGIGKPFPISICGIFIDFLNFQNFAGKRNGLQLVTQQ